MINELTNLDKGFIAEKFVQLKIIEKGFLTLEPVIESGNIDLLSYKNNVIKRIQIKAARYEKNYDRFAVGLMRTRHKLYDTSKLDLFAIYLPNRPDIYFIPSKILKNKNSAKLYPHRDRTIQIGESYEKFKNNFKLLEQ